MRRYISLIGLLLFSYPGIHAQNVTVSGALAGNGSYAELNTAFSAINSALQTNANILITIVGNTSEITAAAILNQGAWTTLTIQPSGNVGRTISGAYNQLIQLNGADRVVIDGLNAAGNSLTINATSSAADAAAILFINDATSNTVTRCNLQGSSRGVSATANNGAVVWFANAPAGGSGNDNNTISFCDIGPSGSNLPYIGIRSFSDAFFPAKSNDNNTITNNAIHDFYSATSNTATNGINIFNYNSGWVITNNKIYQSATRNFPAAQYEYRGIYINTSTSSNGGGFTVTGNVIGYSSSLLLGNTIITGSSNIFNGITYIASASSLASLISNNTISAIHQTTSRSPAAGSGSGIQAFIGIGVFSGQATVSDNIIGATSGTGSILIQTTQTSLSLVNCISMILNQGSGNNMISGNTIGSITVSFGIGTSSMSLAAIRNESTGIVLIAGNTIGNSTANNITSNQTLANITGIQSISSPVTIIANTIQNLTSTAANTGTGAAASVIAMQNSLPAISGDNISGNKITAIKNIAATASAIEVRGIYWNAAAGGSAAVIENNQLSDLQITSTSANSLIAVITTVNATGNFSLYNNMVSAGNSGAPSCMIRGIFISGGMVTCYFNSVRIMGAASIGSGVSAACYMSAGNTFIARDNIFVSERSSIGAAPKNYSIFFAGAFSYTGNNNDLYASGNAGILGFNGSDQGTIAAWSSSTPGAQDNPSAGILSSISQAVSFISATDLHLDAAANCAFIGKGIPLTVIADLDGDIRSLVNPDMGADEFGIARWTGTTSTDWSSISNWATGMVPTQYEDVVIPSFTPFSPAIFLADANCHSLTIYSGALLSMSNNRVLTFTPFCTDSYFSNDGIFSAGTGDETVIFSGNGNISGPVTFNDITIDGVVDFGTQSSVNKYFRINNGGLVSNMHPLSYISGSILQYNINGSYSRGTEWSSASGAGFPDHVQISNYTILNLGSGGASIARECSGDLTIDAGSGLTMDNFPDQMTDDLTVGGDITINGSLTQSSLNTFPYNDIDVKGNWTRGASGVFNPNCRAVSFTGVAVDQTVTVSGGGTEIFNNIIIDKPGKKLVLASNTDLKITALNLCGLGEDNLTIVNGDIDINGRSLYLEGPVGLPAGTDVMYLKVHNGIRSILSSVPGGIVNVSGAVNSRTVTIADGGGAGKILFGDDVELQDENGEIDFGSGNLGSINHILRINSGGAITGNAPYYAENSKLLFSTGSVYDLLSTQKVWMEGSSGALAGVPWDVEINLPNTDIRTSDNTDRSVRNDFNMISGTFELGTGLFTSGNLTIGGDWLRNLSTGFFIPNTNKIIFNSSINAAPQNQSINISGGGAETFYDLESDNNDGITLSGSTDVNVTHHLFLTKGIVSTAANEIYVQDAAAASVTCYASDNSANSWINGNLRRKIVTGSYSFPIGSSNIFNAGGYELAILDFNSNNNIDNIVCRFTADATTVSDEIFSLVVSGTTILDRLDAGYWNFQPCDGSLTMIGAPDCSYNISLNERGHTNSAVDPGYYAIIKRADCMDPCLSQWNQQCGIHSDGTQTEPVIGETAHAERTGFTCTTFSDYAIGKGEFILPLTLIDFNVSNVNGEALLRWITASEYNSDYFSIERSIDGVNFSANGKEKAAGFSTGEIYYSFTDHSMSEIRADKIFYRLKMVDADGSFDYSPVRWINADFSDGFQDVKIFPNPFSDHFSISIFSSYYQEMRIQLKDASGKILYEKNEMAGEDDNFFPIDIPLSLSAGMYFIDVSSASMEYISLMVKLP